MEKHNEMKRGLSAKFSGRFLLVGAGKTYCLWCKEYGILLNEQRISF